MTARALLALSGLALVAACAGEGRSAASGRATFAWRSPDSLVGDGRWEGRVAAGWCDSSRTLAVIGWRADTGLALRLLGPRTSGTVPLGPASDSATGGATLAVRWLHRSQLLALRSDSGRLEIAAADPSLSARFDASVAGLGGALPASVAGRLDGVPVQGGAAGCRLVHGGQSAGSGVP
ncbi:MAG: hypothetical protein MUC69_03615 [Gemmatimonadales bacterium]|nr:hypothetical protein [Gemmatimonadales bacterium]